MLDTRIALCIGRSGGRYQRRALSVKVDRVQSTTRLLRRLSEDRHYRLGGGPKGSEPKTAATFTNSQLSLALDKYPGSISQFTSLGLVIPCG